MKIRLIGPRNFLGVGVHFSNYADALKRRVGVEVLEIDGDDHPTLYAEASVSQPDDINICFVCMNIEQFFRGHNVQWIVFETSRIPEIVLNTIRQSTDIWVPTTWGMNTLISNGIDTAKISIVQEGVNSNNFYPALAPNKTPFRFLTVGKCERRKSIAETITAFNQAFGNDPTVELVIKTDHFFRLAEKQQELAEFVEKLGSTNIHFIWGKIDPQDMLALYQSASIFVFPSKGEAWGLPLIEAIACGVPAVTTFCTGQMQYLVKYKSSCIPVAYDLVPVDCPEFKLFYPDSDERYGMWAQPQVDNLAQALIKAKDNYATLRSHALENSSMIQQDYSWDNSAETSVAIMQQKGWLKK